MRMMSRGLDHGIVEAEKHAEIKITILHPMLVKSPPLQNKVMCRLRYCHIES